MEYWIFGRRILLVSIALLLLFGGVPAQAKDEYPSHNIKLLMPYAPGGSSDATGRVLAEKASKILGQPIEIINKPGGSGTIATAAVASAKPDGYTLCSVAPAQLSIVPHQRDLTYHPIDDLTPVMQYAGFSLALAVRAESPYKKLADFIQAARSAPGTVNYGSTGAGSIGQLLMEQLARLEKVKISHVPFSGGGPAITALLGGHIQAFAAAEYYPHVAAGKIRVLAFLGESKLEELPDVPTLADLGYPLKHGVFFGFVGPKGLPKPVLSKLEGAFLEATKDPDFRKVMKSFLIQVKVRNSQQFGEVIKEVYTENGKIIADLGLGKK